MIGELVAFDYKMHHSLKSHPTAPIFNYKKKNLIPWRFNKKISGGGNFLDMGLHVIDFLLDVFGEIKDFQYLKNKSKKYYDVEESLILNLFFKSGILGQGAWHSTVSKKKDIMCIYGSKGFIEFSFNFKNKILLMKGNKKIIKYIKLEQPPHKNLVKKVIKIFYNCMKNNQIYIDQKSLKLTNFQNKII